MSVRDDVQVNGPADGLSERGARRVLDVARTVLGDLELAAVMERVLEAAQELADARYAALGVLDRSGNALEHFLTLGIDEETRRAIGSLPKGRGVLGELIRDPVPLRVADIGAHPRSYGFPFGHPQMSTFLGVPILIRGRPFGNLYLADKRNGLEFDEQDEHALVLLAEFAGTAIDHARRYTDAENGRRELQQTVEALDATLQIAQALGGETELDRMLALVAKRGRALVSARALVIEHLRDGELVVAAAAGELPDGLAGRTLELHDSVAGAALRSLRTQRLEEETNRERFARYGLGRHGLTAAGGLVVPLVFHGRGYGAMVAIDCLQDGPRFNARDQRLLEAFATSAATAIATAHSVRDDRRSQRLAAAEQERARWARELHDETLQGMAALRLVLAAALRNAGGDGALAGPVRDTIAALERDIAALRSLINDLRPAALDQLGPQAAIETLAARNAGLGLEVTLDVDLNGSIRHTPELETAIYRIIQEALTNARKHGDARHASVTVDDDGATIRIRVQDDGSGFDPAAPSDGFGLVSMRERAGLLDGTVQVDSTPGAGAVVSATFPARRRAAA